ncbi:hypothetical protein [Sinisalibacter aestuarii]|uniref:Uncharacterized protein n=1 Tax=Sinisalibacter aestuarii TaxID=2949426 RepID=A0ABQ5LQ38_9RHOB|nr:hypothetical protein [Sinisalibacter aestuarii]GKY87122.1 hypothetical protein STA1M1_09910 [Sinisalibacter aestuarii]
MGYSVPKKPFDLKEFLSEKASPRRSRWSYRARAAAAQKPASEPKQKKPPKAPAEQ